MIKTEVYPENKDFFKRLADFAREIIDLCNEVGVRPLLYGSLAYFAYTSDTKISIHDVDTLIKDNDFIKLIELFKKNKLKYNYNEKWHTLEVYRDDLKFDLDSEEFWIKEISDKSENINIDGLILRVINLNSLVEIYEKAVENSRDKRNEYNQKLINLKKLI